MKYRKLGRSGLDVSVVGLGLEHLETADRMTVNDILSCLMDSGGNYIDLFMGSPGIRDHVGSALKGRRSKMMVCGHLGATWQNGQYARSRDPAVCRQFVDDLLMRLDSDYLDVLMIHFVDDHQELDTILASGGLMDIANEYRKSGFARTVGLSSHVPSVAKRAVETGMIDVLMFPVNPVFDSIPGDRDINELFNPATFTPNGRGADPARSSMYDACDRHGTAIVAMKTYAAGRLLQGNSQLNLKMTAAQCIQYVLDRPGVASALPGCRTTAEMEAALAYVTASPEQRDYSEVLAASLLWNQSNDCMYCNHCLPCPVGIDIAEVDRKSVV